MPGPARPTMSRLPGRPAGRLRAGPLRGPRRAATGSAPSRRPRPRPCSGTPPGPSPSTRYPYAVIGAGSWANYKVSADVLLPSRHSAAGLIGRFSCRSTAPNAGAFDGYVFNVSGTGAWRLTRNANPDPQLAHSGCASGPTADAGPGLRPPGPAADAWAAGTACSLSMSGTTITASVGRGRGGRRDRQRPGPPAWPASRPGPSAQLLAARPVQPPHLSVTPLPP